MSVKSPEPTANEGGQADTFVAERASAVPLGVQRQPKQHGATAKKGAAAAIRTPRRPPASAKIKAATTPAPPPLASLQAAFLEVVTHPHSLKAALRVAPNGVDALLTGIDPGAGLAVYHFAYRTRLIEALADDFPAVQYAMGSDVFSRFAASVVAQNPSRTRNLNVYGKVLVDALTSPRCRVVRRTFLADLAKLEWALVLAIHAAPAKQLDPSTLAAIPQERWEDLVFMPSASLQVHRSRWPTNRYLQAFREGACPDLPPRGKHEFATAIYREGFRVWRMDLSPLAAGLMERLVQGAPLGRALEPLEGRAEAKNVMRWFQAWVGGGVFSGVRFS